MSGAGGLSQSEQNLAREAMRKQAEERMLAQAAGIDTESSSSSGGGWDMAMQFGGMLVWMSCMALLWLGYMVYTQESVLFHPDSPAPQYRSPSSLPKQLQMCSPEDRDMPYDNVTLTAADGVKTNAWLIWSDVAPDHAPTIMFFHGNAGNMGLRLDNVQALRNAFHKSANFFMCEYRGYGDSQGTPTEQGLHLDAEAALDHLKSREDVHHGRIFAFGRSLGGAVVMRLMAERNGELAGGMVENSFTSIDEMAIKLFPFIRILGDWRHAVLRLKFDSLEAAPRITAPMLMIAGLADELIPPIMGARLYKALGTPESKKSMMTVESGGHNDSWKAGGLQYMRTLVRFVRRHAGLEAPAPAQTKRKSSGGRAGEEAASAGDGEQGESGSAAEASPDGQGGAAEAQA